MSKYYVQLSMLLLLAFIMVTVGIMHIRSPQPFVSIVPAYLPAPLVLVYLSGVFEVLGGVGLILPITRKAASIGLIALYIAVFPANVNMAVNNVPINGQHFHPWLLWLRLPLQLVLIGWAWYVGNVKKPIHARRLEGIFPFPSE
jgi:uncharacterized membrane protein